MMTVRRPYIVMLGQWIEHERETLAEAIAAAQEIVDQAAADGEPVPLVRVVQVIETVSDEGVT